MRAVVQRVTAARVSVGDAETGRIGCGLLVFLGVGHNDGPADIDYIADKIPALRIFPDEAGRMQRSVRDVGGSLLVVSQFTLYGDCRRGRRPSFTAAAAPEPARAMYEALVARWRAAGLQVATGDFQAHMAVALVNDGPVTLILDSDERRAARAGGAAR